MQPDDWVAKYDRAERARDAAALVDGRHYTEFVAEVKALRKSGDDDAAAGLLLRLIDAVDREAQIPLAGCSGVPGWYFDQLGVIYGKKGMPNERGLLVQRHMRLQIQAETQGRIAKMKMNAAVAADADPADSSGLGVRVVERRPAAERKPRAPGGAEKAGRAAGKAVGMLARILGLK